MTPPAGMRRSVNTSINTRPQDYRTRRYVGLGLQQEVDLGHWRERPFLTMLAHSAVRKKQAFDGIQPGVEGAVPLSRAPDGTSAWSEMGMDVFETEVLPRPEQQDRPGREMLFRANPTDV